MLLSKNKICYIKVGCKPRGSTLHGLVSIMPCLLLQAYELREYDASNWVSVNMVDKRQMFMKLFGYIRGANTKGKIFLNIRSYRSNSKRTKCSEKQFLIFVIFVPFFQHVRS